MLRVVYSRHYDLGFFGLERLHPFDIHKYSRAWRMLRPYAEVVRLSVGVLLFAGLTVSVARLVESPLQPVFGATRVEELLFQQSVVAVWWLLAAKLLPGGKAAPDRTPASWPRKEQTAR